MQKAQLSEELIDASRQKAGKRHQQPVVVADDSSDNRLSSQSASTGSMGTSVGSRRSKKKELTLEQIVTALGKKFCILYHPWPDSTSIEALGDDCPDIDINSFSDRYGRGSDPERERMAVTAEAWNLLGENKEARYAVAHDVEMAKVVRIYVLLCQSIYL